MSIFKYIPKNIQGYSMNNIFAVYYHEKVQYLWIVIMFTYFTGYIYSLYFYLRSLIIMKILEMLDHWIKLIKELVLVLSVLQHVEML